MLASTTRRWDEAERHFREAIELSARIGARPSLAHTQVEYARLLAERGDADGGAKALAAARTTYHELGMEFSAARARASGSGES